MFHGATEMGGTRSAAGPLVAFNLPAVGIWETTLLGS